MVAVRKHFVLVRQVGAARVDQVDAGQAVLLRHFLRPQVLLHRHRVVGAALHRGVVADDHAIDAADAADAGDHAGAGAHRRCTCRARPAAPVPGTACPGPAASAPDREAAACRAPRGGPARLRPRRPRPLAICAFRSSTSARMAAALAWKSADRGLSCVSRAGMSCSRLGSGHPSAPALFAAPSRSHEGCKSCHDAPDFIHAHPCPAFTGPPARRRHADGFRPSHRGRLPAPRPRPGAGPEAGTDHAIQTAAARRPHHCPADGTALRRGHARAGR